MNINYSPAASTTCIKCGDVVYEVYWFISLSLPLASTLRVLSRGKQVYFRYDDPFGKVIEHE